METGEPSGSLKSVNKCYSSITRSNPRNMLPNQQNALKLDNKGITKANDNCSKETIRIFLYRVFK